MELNKNRELNYVCINCGSNVKELHKKFSSSVLKIMNCDKCHQTADKYIEFEPIVILIDLVLLSRGAYRHVLYNTYFGKCNLITVLQKATERLTAVLLTYEFQQIYSKILVVQLLFESYRIWKDGPRTTNNGEYTAEKEFYFSFFLTVIDYIILFLMLWLWTKIAGQKWIAEKSQRTHLVKAITLANIAKFFMIPIVIWSNNATEVASLQLVLVNCYYFLSLVHVLAVLVNCSRKQSGVMALVTVVLKHILMVEVTQRLKHFVII